MIAIVYVVLVGLAVRADNPSARSDSCSLRCCRVVELLDLLKDSGLIQLGLEPNVTAPDPRGDIVLSLQIEKSAAGREEVQELTRRLALDPPDIRADNCNRLVGVSVRSSLG